MNIRPTTLRAFCGAALLMGAAASHAAPDANAEAGAARDAAGKGALKSSGSNEKAANAVERCEVFSKADEHAACLDRIRGSGQTSGSALQGGVLRESVTTTTTVIPAKP